MSGSDLMDIAIYGPLEKRETGPSAVCRGLVYGLDVIGHNVTLYTTGDDTHDEAKTIHVDGSVDSVVNFIKTKTKIAKTVRREDHDIFHSLPGLIHGADICTVQGIWSDLQMLRWAPHTIQPRDFVGANIYSLLKTYGYWKTDVLVATSPLVAEQIRTFIRRDVEDIIGLGIREEHRDPPAPVGETVNILMPGMVSPIKGHHRILQHLDPTDERFELDIVGKVVDESYVWKFPEWRDNIHGYVDDINEFYERADVVLLPSEHETYLMTAVEAIARGCVVIITDTCGFAQFDRVRQNPGVFVVSDGEEMSAVLENVLSSDIFGRKVSAYELSATFTWDRIAENYDTIYKRLD